MDDATREAIRRMHRKTSRSWWQSNFYLAIYFTCIAASLWCWTHGFWPVTVLLWGITAHLGHMNLIALHEASHYTLHPRRWLNELNALVVGSVALTPLAAYRHVHHQHHLHMGTERDTELWPFVNPTAPRWKRWLAAFGELFLGFFYTPIIFLRGVLVARNLPRRQVRRLWAEYALCLVVWAALLGAVQHFGAWEYLLVGYLVPTIIAGNLQSFRKFTEHMGLTGDGILANTRSVVDTSVVGQALSGSLMHIDFHGAHHRYAKIPHHRLPEATTLVYDAADKEAPVFRAYWAAVWDMVKTLRDPRVGNQWHETEQTPA